MRKHSELTPFISQQIIKMTETGIKDALAKRHIVTKPNCQSINYKGNPLGIEKFASLFALYALGCFTSLIIFLLENLFKPSKPTKMTDFKLIIAIKSIQKELESFSDDMEMQLFLLNQVKRLHFKKKKFLELSTCTDGQM